MFLRYVSITKVATPPSPAAPAGDPKSFAAGGYNPGVSLPLGYEAKGWLPRAPAIGDCVVLYREERNGVKAEGRLVTSSVTAVGDGTFETANSTYAWREEAPPVRTSPNRNHSEPHHSAYHLATVHAVAAELFSSNAAISEWLNSPAPALNGRRPADVAISDPQSVVAVLRGIEHGNVM